MAANNVHERIENFLIDLELPFERLDDGIWVVVDEADHVENLVIYVTDSVLNFRVKVFGLPPEAPAGLFRKLLVLNASEMVHGAFGIEENNVVLVGALEVDNLDLNEFQAIVDSFGLAVSTHYDELTGLLESAGQ